MLNQRGVLWIGAIPIVALWLSVAGCAPTATAPATAAAPAPVATPAPLSPELSSGKYVRGDASAPVTIVEFADYECPYCAQEEPVLNRLMHDYASRVKLVFHDYPVGHPHSIELAEAASCAGEQGGFWAMHDFMFKRPESVDVGMLSQYGSSLGLDGEALDACVKSGRYRKSVEADAAAAVKAGARGTPTFFVDGRRLDGWQSYNQLSEAVDEALVAHGESRNSSN